jgi:WD40 repeat protein
LRPFLESDAGDFFGREALTQQLLGRMTEEVEMSCFLAVVGPSGSGKSSVVRAGVVPALRGRGSPGPDGRPVIYVVPGAHPLEEVEAALLRVAVNPPATLLEQLRQDERGLLRAAKRTLPGQDGDGARDTNGLVLVVDQFEELFTLVHDEAERTFFLRSLYTAVSDPRSPLTVIATLRADFFDRPLLYADSGEMVRRRTEVILPLTPDELERAIVQPAARVGVALELDLLATILRDVSEQPGTLPLLQYALMELFERREGGLMTLAAYRATGGVARAISQRAESIYVSLNPIEQEEARQLFLRLVNLGEGVEDTRRRVLRSEIATAARDEEALERVLELFGNHRLLSFDGDAATGRPTVEMAHEALLQVWPRLREWLDASRESLRVQRRLITAVGEWIGAGRDPSFLAGSGVRLAQFEALASEAGTPQGVALNEDERSYLAASIDERDRHEREQEERQQRELELARSSARAQRSAAVRLRYLAGALVLLAGVAVGLLLITLDRQRQAEANLTHTAALRLAAEANTLLQTHGDPELASLLTIRSLNLAYNPQGDIDLAQAEMLQLPTQRYTLPSSLMDLAVSPDGKWAASANFRRIATILDIQTGQTLRQLTGHEGPLSSVAFSPDGKYLLTGSFDKTARLWDAHTGAQIRVFRGHTDLVNGVAFSPDGLRILTGSSDGTAVIWDATTGDQLITLKGHDGAVNRIAFSPDGKTVLTSGQNKTARLWDAQSGKQLQVYAGHNDNIFSVIFSPDGKQVLTGSDDGTARLWDAASGKESQRFDAKGGGVLGIAFSPDGSRVLVGTADKVARLWDAQSGALISSYYGHADLVNGAAFTPDGEWLLTGSVDATIRRWKADPSPELPVIHEPSGGLLSAIYSPDGSKIATGSDSGDVRIWDAGTGKQSTPLAQLRGAVGGLVFSSDGKSIYATGAGDDGFAVQLMNVQDGQVVRLFRGHTAQITSLAVSPDGKFLLTGSLDDSAGLWDTATGTRVRRLEQPDQVTGVAFSPDGKYLLTGSPDMIVRLWDAASGSLIRSYTGAQGAINSVVFSADGKHFLTGENGSTGILWGVDSGKPELTLAGQEGGITSVAFSPDGKYLLTGGADMTVRMWDARTGQEVRRFAGHSDVVSSVAFSPDGSKVLTAGVDGVARVWNVDYGQTIRSLCGRLKRDLTDEERKSYSIPLADQTCSLPNAGH